MKFYLNQTNGGLDIFRRYIKHNFTVRESFEVDNDRYTIKWSDRYENYVLCHERYDSKRWRWHQNYNAIYFLQEKFRLTPIEVYAKLVLEMNLTMHPKEPSVESTAIIVTPVQVLEPTSKPKEMVAEPTPPIELLTINLDLDGL